MADEIKTNDLVLVPVLCKVVASGGETLHVVIVDNPIGGFNIPVVAVTKQQPS